jgi:HAD superfamily hydrolase (TIGR01549 family)
MSLQGVIFDLDGTLIDSALDFNLMRGDLGIPVGQPILEFLYKMEYGDEKTRLLDILREHELAGANRATLMPGVEEFLVELNSRRLNTGILTRNSREATERSLHKLNLEFTHVLTREDCPYKPDPAGLLSICRTWNAEPAHVLYFGDYLFDLQAGQNAGMPTVLYSPQELPDYAHLADFTISHFSEALALLDAV